MIDHKASEALLEKARQDAEEMAKLKKKSNDDEDKDKDKDKKEAPADVKRTIINVDDDDDIPDDAPVKIHPDTTFETLKDWSTALIIRSGFR